VQLIGSYTDPSFLGLLLSPIADMDLSISLADNPDRPLSVKMQQYELGLVAL